MPVGRDVDRLKTIHCVGCAYPEEQVIIGMVVW